MLGVIPAILVPFGWVFSNLEFLNMCSTAVFPGKIPLSLSIGDENPDGRAPGFFGMHAKLY